MLFEGQMPGMFDDTISDLTKDRDQWKKVATENGAGVDILEKRLAGKLVSIPPSDPDLVARLDLLEQENRNLKSKNHNLEEEVRDLRRSQSLLHDDNDGKSRKLRGANKRVQNAKNIADKEKDKANDALLQKQLRLESERKMRKELKDEKAKVASCQNEIADLKAKLDCETKGLPHIRDNSNTGDETTVAFTVQFPVHRQHFQKLKGILESNRVKLTQNMVEWYDEWKKPQNGTEKGVGVRTVDSRDEELYAYDSELDGLID